MGGVWWEGGTYLRTSHDAAGFLWGRLEGRERSPGGVTQTQRPQAEKVKIAEEWPITAKLISSTYGNYFVTKEGGKKVVCA